MTTIITLTTDFGHRDSYVGMMKGVILSITTDVRLVDLTHEIPPQDVLAGSIAMEDAIVHFPAGSIHVGVIDPGVGTTRRPIAVRAGGQTFIGPDNGLLWPAIHAVSRSSGGEELIVAHELTNTNLFRAAVSSTFHGRDIFAPVAAHLAAGVPLENVGVRIREPLDDLIRPQLPLPRHVNDATVIGRVIAVDHFGNLITNIHEHDLRGFDRANARVRIGAVLIDRISRTFADVPPGEPVTYFGSSGRLEIAMRNTNAARTLEVNLGEHVEITSLET